MKTIWVRNENLRVYAPGGSGGPLESGHWQEVEITGETRVSWVTKRAGKFPKKYPPYPNYRFTRAEVDDCIFVQENRHKIADVIERSRDASKLRKIAEIVGYRKGKL
jgi:hypothetical protein